MTKRAIFRRQCIRAKRTLIRRWPRVYEEDSFEIADGSDHDVLPGTPIYWTEPFYGGESDCRPAVEELRDLLLAERLDWSRLWSEEEFREKYRNYVYFGKAEAER